MKENTLSKINHLKELQELVDELNENNSKTWKKEVLARYPQCKDLLKVVYNPFTTFGVTSKTVKKMISVDGQKFADIFKLTDALANRSLSGHAALKAVNRFVEDNKKYEDLIWMILDRNLQTRANEKLINQVWPKFIPVFDLALVKDYEAYKHRVDFKNDNWYASRKMNGGRVVMKIYSKKNMISYSRYGNEFTSLDVLKEAIRKSLPKEYKSGVLDGEVCQLDENGKENFRQIIGDLKKKNFTIENPQYSLIDSLTHEEFESRESESLFTDRQDQLKYLYPKAVDHVKVLKQIRIKSEEHLEKLFKKAVSLGWEGLIIRKDTTYKGKRCPDLLRVKLWKYEEFKVTDVEMGMIRRIVKKDPDTGEVFKKPTEITREMLAAAFIKYKNNVVRIGSGWNMEEREYYHKYPKKLIGAVLTIRYFEESTDKTTGLPSLQFPTMQIIHGRKREV